MERHLGTTRLTLLQGDITTHAADAIANAANSGLQGGGGVDGAIHRAGGPELMEQCLTIRNRDGGCPTGQAVLTTGGRLPCRYVIHTVGPIWRGGEHGEAAQLASCYSASLGLAAAHGCRTLAFPSISTGVYGYPAEQAACVAVTAVLSFVRQQPSGFERISWVLFDASTYQAYAAALATALSSD